MDKIKKILFKTLFVILCVGTCFSSIHNVHADPPVGFSGTVEIPNTIKEPDIAKIIEASLLWLLGIAGSIALLMLIIAGIMYITSSGDEQKVVTAKKIFNFTVMGLILVLLSYSIIVVLRDVLI